MQQGQAQRVVMVVHGIGDPKEGDALGSLVNAYGAKCQVQYGDLGPRTVRHLEEEDGTGKARLSQNKRPGLVRTFPVHEQEMQVPNGRRLRFVEVYWGDLARVPAGLPGLVLAFMDLVFGLRFIARAARDELVKRHPFRGRWLGDSAALAQWTIGGPVLTLNAMGMLGVLSAMAFASLGWSNAGVMFATGVLTLAAGGAAKGLAGRLEWSNTFAYLAMAFGAFGMIAGIAERGTSGNELETVVEIGTQVMIGVTLVATLAAFSMFLGFFSLLGKGREGLVVITTTVLSCALLMLLLLGGWAFVANRLEAMKAVPNLPTVYGNSIPVAIGKATHFFAIVWSPFIFLAFAAAVVALSYWFRYRRVGVPQEHHYPRWIVNGSFVFVLLVAGIVGTALYFFYAACGPGAASNVVRDLFARPLCEGAFARGALDFGIKVDSWGTVMAALTLAAASGAIVARAYVGVGLDLVLDVIAHFERHRKTGDRKNWERMLGRFRVVAKSLGSVPEVVVVSHSQGTMIALASLGLVVDDGAKPLEGGFRCRLVTMGCPLTDLYRYYFPKRYPVKTNPQVNSWLNIYRVNDFVGKSVQGLDKGAPQVDNRPIAPRGHTNYWLDDEVLGVLVKEGILA